MARPPAFFTASGVASRITLPALPAAPETFRRPFAIASLIFGGSDLRSALRCQNSFKSA